MPKLLLFDEQARAKLLSGINQAAQAVATTLGPKGRNVAIDRKWGAPLVVHDGVTVCNEIELADPFENMGAQLLKEAAAKTNDSAGDGTTTATVLAQAIVAEGLRNIQAGANPMILKKGMEQAVALLVSQLHKMSKKLVTPQEIIQVATISAADPVIGNLIAEALKKVGNDGVVTVEENNTFEMAIDHRQGMELDKGYVSPYFVTDTDKMEAVIKDAYVLITDLRISNPTEILPFLNGFVANTNKNLVIIAEAVDGEALKLLIVNKMRSVANILAVQAPGYGDSQKDLLADLAILTGGIVISAESGKKLETIELAELGRADQITATKDKMTIVGGRGQAKKIFARISQIKQALNQAQSEFEKEKLQARLAKLTGGVAVIQVGAMTEAELKDKKERVIDAVAATKAALEEGIVPGGEIILLRARAVLQQLDHLTGEEKLGVEIISRALEQPFRQLMKNAGLADESMLYQVLVIDNNMGVDVLDGTIKDLVKAGIIDPVKVTRSALQYAASTAMMVMTTDCLITEKPIEAKEIKS